MKSSMSSGASGLRTYPVSYQLGAMLVGTLCLTLASYVSVPMVPVPVSMQTFAVVVVGALFGWKRGGITIAAWLTAGVSGLPVLANGASGLSYALGPTGGYLFAFALVGMLMGGLAERGWNGRRPLLAFSGALIAHVLCLGLGAAWLAGFVGAHKAMVAGVVPFLLGAVLKSALAAASLATLSGVRTRFSKRLS